jgi:hypothetical protein
MNKPITPKKFATDLWDMMQMAIDEAVAAERERIIAANAPEIEKTNKHIKMLEDEIAAIRARGEQA